MAVTPTLDYSAAIISILGFYLSLTSLLASFFFVHITNWYLRIVAVQVSWDQVRSVDDRSAWIDCLIKGRVERSPQPFFVFLLFGGFLGTLAYFADAIRRRKPIDPSLVDFLYTPGTIFLGIFVVVSLVYLAAGYLKVFRLTADIERKL
jgi:hypothetical protein